jgi:penicillin-binding protein 1A
MLAHGFSVGSLFLLAGAFVAAACIAPAIKDLPDHRVLATWEPASVARVYSSDGELVTEYARERRLPLPIESIPETVRQAFLSAEDKNFYSHSGLDPLGLAKAIVTNLVNVGSERRLIGASTITQQVVKNLLLTPDRTFKRKIREAVLSLRMEQAYSKDKILELYLNGIYLGAGSYGVASASQTYFGKPLEMLGIGEAALLAALPKAPNNYNPFVDKAAAVARRNWVLGQMAANGFISPKAASREAAAPLQLAPRKSAYTLHSAEYFSEEVRRSLASRFGADALYEGGFTIRTTLHPEFQQAALAALRRGLVRYDETRGYRGPVASIDPSGNWQEALAAIDSYSDVPEWRLAVVLDTSADRARIGLGARADMPPEIAKMGSIERADMTWALRVHEKGKVRTVQRVDMVLRPGDVVYVEENGGRYRLRQSPKVQGALVSLDPRTGRVLALVGGFSFSQSKFNRATQAYRQPGSAFKPFIYAAALDAGYTPATLVMDAPVAIPDGAGRMWRPKNYDGRFGGPSTLRTGLERSRNLMTVRLARHLGMDLVVDYSRRFGLYDELKPYLPMALGAGETTLMRLVSAYAVIANGGKAVRPSLIDSVEDRYGQILYQNGCDGCGAADGSQPVEQPDYVLDPMTAYQITSMMRGVVERGTASSVGRLGIPIAGKTGTTNDEKDVWFVGFTPDMVTGVFMGYDTPLPMGYRESGGGLAAPVFIDFMKTALRNGTAKDFDVPEGLTFIAVDRHSGRLSSKDSPGAIIEGFKPGTAPCSSSCSVIDGYEATPTQPVAADEVSAELREKLLNGAGLY